MAEKLSLWTVYKHPKDFPDDYVARRFELDQATQEFYANPKIELVREWIVTNAQKYNQGSPYKISPEPNDDPVILESWV